jgi:hypothetical protein
MLSFRTAFCEGSVFLQASAENKTIPLALMRMAHQLFFNCVNNATFSKQTLAEYSTYFEKQRNTCMWRMKLKIQEWRKWFGERRYAFVALALRNISR